MATKKRGRPRTGVGVQIGMRWSQEDLQVIDTFARSHKITRTEAIRQLVRAGLSGTTASRTKEPSVTEGWRWPRAGKRGKGEQP